MDFNNCGKFEDIAKHVLETYLMTNDNGNPWGEISDKIDIVNNKEYADAFADNKNKKCMNILGEATFLDIVPVKHVVTATEKTCISFTMKDIKTNMIFDLEFFENGQIFFNRVCRTEIGMKDLIRGLTQEHIDYIKKVLAMANPDYQMTIHDVLAVNPKKVEAYYHYRETVWGESDFDIYVDGNEIGQITLFNDHVNGIVETNNILTPAEASLVFNNIRKKPLIMSRYYEDDKCMPYDEECIGIAIKNLECCVMKDHIEDSEDGHKILKFHVIWNGKNMADSKCFSYDLETHNILNELFINTESRNRLKALLEVFESSPDSRYVEFDMNYRPVAVETTKFYTA